MSSIADSLEEWLTPGLEHCFTSIFQILGRIETSLIAIASSAQMSSQEPYDPKRPQKGQIWLLRRSAIGERNLSKTPRPFRPVRNISSTTVWRGGEKNSFAAFEASGSKS